MLCWWVIDPERKEDPSKCWEPLYQWQGITSQKPWILNMNMWVLSTINQAAFPDIVKAAHCDCLWHSCILHSLLCPSLMLHSSLLWFYKFYYSLCYLYLLTFLITSSICSVSFHCFPFSNMSSLLAFMPSNLHIVTFSSFLLCVREQFFSWISVPHLLFLHFIPLFYWSL